ncbi:FAD/NAD(P)-binding domain-containing protein [Cadophora sp. DSE1049]|nr:FAD/NAD(P)-binding domain-containing protein [Cadophora sp. DSE1049]
METDQSRLKVLICGGGIAGFATALMLREDHDVTILERSPLNEEMGAAITLSMNATRLLKRSFSRAGFDPVKARCVEAEKLNADCVFSLQEQFQELHWKDLSVLVEFQMKTVLEKYGEPWWYFSRLDVHKELKRAALSEDGLGRTPFLQLGAHVNRVDLSSKTVHLESGQSFTADVIIGADGIRTATGNSVFGNVPSVSHGFSAYRCMIPSGRMKSDPETQILVDCTKILTFIGPDRRIVAYPCSNWDYLNFVCIFPETSEREKQWTSVVTVEEMLDTFSDFHPSIVKALSMATSCGVWQLRDRDPLATLVKGPYAMIGDAAHAMGPYLGQGGCQAIEDAEVLRIILKGATVQDIEQRLAIFDDLRVPRLRTIIEYTRAAAPKRSMVDKVEHKNSDTYGDYSWRYELLQEGVEAMRRHGYKMKITDPDTGTIALA